MRNLDAVFALNMLSDGVRDHHRAVAAAGAADRDRDVGFAFLLVLGKQKVDESVDVIQELVRGIVRVHVFDHVLVGARERFQVRFEVWIGKKSDVENQIGIDRNSVLESKAHKRHEQVLGFPFLEQPHRVLPQLMDRKLGSVQNLIGHRPDWRQQIALERNGLQHRPIRIKRMRASCFAEAADQHSIRGFQKPKRNLERRILFEILQDRWKVAQRLAFANVDDQRGFCGLIVGLENQFVELGEKADGKVVDTEVSTVFKRPEESSLPRTAQAGDDDEREWLGEGIRGLNNCEVAIG